jgi:hypothetical protein
VGPRGIESWWCQTQLLQELSPGQAQPHSHTTATAGALLQLLVQTCLYSCFMSHLPSHSDLPGPLADGNAWADNLVSELALGLPTQTAAAHRCSRLSHAVYHQNASALHSQFLSITLYTLGRPLGTYCSLFGSVESRACLCFS